MKYPFANPNLRFIDFLCALNISSNNAKYIIENYFRNITGKRYILITNSCRTALYIAYKAIDKKGEVVTSPLTCKAAIDPIEESDNIPVYADIKLSDLNINPDDIQHRISNNTVAIQPIHIGGNSCDMEEITEIARNNNLFLIEDCAQSLGATHKGKNTGSFGDISCFSLIKNAYGIGGGILATDSYKIYEKAKSINGECAKPSKFLLFYRIIRNIFDTKRKYYIWRILFNTLMKLRSKRKHYRNVAMQLYQISDIELKIAALQIKRINQLHLERKKVGKTFYDVLLKNDFMINKNYDKDNSSFTKLILYNPNINSRQYLQILNNNGIEAMHLEHKYGSPYQERLISKAEADKIGLINYNKVHDSLLALPLTEYMKYNDIEYIVKTMERINGRSETFKHIN